MQTTIAAARRIVAASSSNRSQTGDRADRPKPLTAIKTGPCEPAGKSASVSIAPPGSVATHRRMDS